jgi:hypothetical protein
MEHVAGQLAGEKVRIGKFSVAPVHTRFGTVQWFVWDEERMDYDDLPVVVRQAETREAAVEGLA